MNSGRTDKSSFPLKEKFVAWRHIVFPRELFIELKLSKKQIEKVKGWKKDGHSEWFPMWFCSLERVLFVNEDLWNEYLRKKGKE